MTRQEVIPMPNPTQHPTIAAALCAAQMEMGPALKQSNNPAFKSKYADLGNVMEACLPALNRNGIAVIQPIGEDATGRHVRTVLVHSSGQTLECSVPLIVSKNDMQGFGSAVTYARRYGLMAMAGIAPEDDDGNAAAKHPPRQQEQHARIEIVENNATAGLGDAWRDAVMDSLPEDATSRQKAEAFAAAICRDFNAKTGVKALENDWERRTKIIEAFEAQHMDLFGKVVDAYENRMMALTGNLHQGAG